MSTGEYDEADRRNTSKILERQLPHLTQRLQLSLDKLQTPEKSDLNTSLISEWWNELLKSNDTEDFQFICDISNDASIPVELFDTVTENILENLREKSRLNSELDVTVKIVSNDDSTCLTITDNGQAIADKVAKSILKDPIDSRSGLGIGLYQASQLAAELGFQLNLISNVDGDVSFELKC